MNRIYVISLNEDARQLFTADVTPIITSNHIFCGAAMQYEIVRTILDENSVWINIDIPYSITFEEIESYLEQGEDIILFVTGDPAYFGFTSSLHKRFPNIEFQMFPTFNKLHALAYHLMIPFHDMYMANFANQTWHSLDYALIKGKPKIGVITDRVHTPAAIAERMMEYGYNNYSIYIGENMENAEGRNVRKMNLVSAASAHFDSSNCVILVKEFENPTQLFGIPDHYFSRLLGEENKITEMPVRLFALSMLELKTKKRLWDIGFCTGSLSIEAKLQFPHLEVVGFDMDPECSNLLAINSCRCGTPGIRSIIGDFCEVDLMLLDSPDTVFIGGHGGKLIEIVGRIVEKAEPGCIIVFCSLNEESNVFFLHACTLFPIQVLEQTRITIDRYHTCTVFKAIST